MDLLTRLNPEPDPAVVAERPQRYQERALFRAMVASVLAAHRGAR